MDSWTFSPYLRVSDADKAIDWYVRALRVVEKERCEMEGKIVHAELNLHGNVLCLADVGPSSQFKQPSTYIDVPITLYAIVPDVDAGFNRSTPIAELASSASTTS